MDYFFITFFCILMAIFILILIRDLRGLKVKEIPTKAKIIPEGTEYMGILDYSESTLTWGMYFPDLPGCVSAGSVDDSLSYILNQSKEALSLHIDGMTEDEQEIPLPKNFRGVSIPYQKGFECT